MNKKEHRKAECAKLTKLIGVKVSAATPMFFPLHSWSRKEEDDFRYHFGQELGDIVYGGND